MTDRLPKPGRMAYRCEHAERGNRDCATRTFIKPSETPICREHGERYMKREANRPYLGQPIPEADA